MRTTFAVLAMLAAALIALPVSNASAHTLRIETARAKATRFIKAFYEERASATDYHAGPCYRQSAHRVACSVSLTANDSTCSGLVIVYFKSRTSKVIKLKPLPSHIPECGTE